MKEKIEIKSSNFFWRWGTGLKLLFVLLVCASILIAFPNDSKAFDKPLRVAIYDGDTDFAIHGYPYHPPYVQYTHGERGIYEALKLVPNINAELVTDLSLETLNDYDVLILPDLHFPLWWNNYWQQNIREYASSGHGVILTHDAMGNAFASYFGAIFPEISCEGRIFDNSPMVIAVQHPITSGFSVGQKYSTQFVDYRVPSPAQNSEVIVRDQQGNPVILASDFGSGRVVISGEIFGFSTGNIEEPPIDGEFQIMLNSILWAGFRNPVVTIDCLAQKKEYFASLGEIRNQGIVVSLDAKLDAAKKALASGNIDAMLNILQAFMNEVLAQRGKHISIEAAEQLVADAKAVKALYSH